MAERVNEQETIAGVTGSVVSSKVRRLLKSRGIPWRTMARKAGIDPSTVVKMGRNPTLKTINSVAAALDVPVEELMTDDDTPGWVTRNTPCMMVYVDKEGRLMVRVRNGTDCSSTCDLTEAVRLLIRTLASGKGVMDTVVKELCRENGEN